MTIETTYFKYGEAEMDFLKQADAVLGAAITRMGKIERTIMPDLFTALIYAVVGQLISVKSAQLAWNRMHELLGGITPHAISVHTPESIQTCGLTMKKAICIHQIACRIVNHEVDLDRLTHLTDVEVISELTAFEGIGRWTAEMLLIHALERPDIVSWGDIAIRRGMMKLYGLSTISKKQFDQYRLRYTPHGSVASFYLWKISYE
ncbi:DNA-3-methyladenine glycosylase 2 family protein [Paenibacillus dokdonensis]|uniref:DNA-3-methyladenine glycosylase II n=1 Tax=Paenibacillus dokdonensis TaxID=2567944 RepID=A0ABU6GRV7_9BACL|nr:DNA-3-methyladenine glycosylase 2 family protein [Paenibacillus dokdonensis]MEC0242480.1 DNA-3-methyladenine glycosylase 2 family protein [Paenibacillus dokdonensis]